MAQHDEQIEPLSDTILPDAQIEQLVGVGQSLIEQAGVFLTTMFRTWNLYQIAIAVGLFAENGLSIPFPQREVKMLD